MSRPSEHLFPIAEFRASCQEVMSGPDIAGILQLGSPGGYEPLRQYLLEGARREGVARPGDDLIITSGCQQALDIVRRVLVRTADKVALEKSEERRVGKECRSRWSSYESKEKTW